MMLFGAFFHAQHQLSIKSDQTQKTKQEGQHKPPGEADARALQLQTQTLKGL